MFRPAPGSTQAPIQWVPGDLSPTGDLIILVAEELLFGMTQNFRVCWTLYDVRDVEEFHVMSRKVSQISRRWYWFLRVINIPRQSTRDLQLHRLRFINL
jgi:hypothetical protein